jgi:hypothetical protein
MPTDKLRPVIHRVHFLLMVLEMNFLLMVLEMNAATTDLTMSAPTAATGLSRRLLVSNVILMNLVHQRTAQQNVF